MNARLHSPTSRLICVGDAKLVTNAIDGTVEEFDNGPLYRPE